MRMFNSHVLPHVLYCSSVWRPLNNCDMVALCRMQRRYVRRVERRCGLTKGALPIYEITDMIKDMDVKYLRKLMRKDDLFDEMFDLSASKTRKAFVFSAKQIAKTETVKNLFPWRIASVINGSH